MGASAGPHLGCHHPLCAFMELPRPGDCWDTSSENLLSSSSRLGHNLHDTVVTTRVSPLPLRKTESVLPTSLLFSSGRSSFEVDKGCFWKK